MYPSDGGAWKHCLGMSIIGMKGGGKGNHAAIESEAVDFLVKPVAKDALIRAFEKVRKKLDGQKASRYSLRHLVSPEVEAREDVLARAVAGGDRVAFDGAWQAWLSAARDASGATLSALSARLVKNVYRRLDDEGVLMPEELARDAAFAATRTI